jgi:hypothetical protein
MTTPRRWRFARAVADVIVFALLAVLFVVASDPGWKTTAFIMAAFVVADFIGDVRATLAHGRASTERMGKS